MYDQVEQRTTKPLAASHLQINVNLMHTGLNRPDPEQSSRRIGVFRLHHETVRPSGIVTERSKQPHQASALLQIA
jgi:hypothetical protein